MGYKHNSYGLIDKISAIIQVWEILTQHARTMSCSFHNFLASVALQSSWDKTVGHSCLTVKKWKVELNTKVGSEKCTDEILS